MLDGNRAGRRLHRQAMGVIGLTVSALVLAACSSTPSTTGTANTAGQTGSGTGTGGGGTSATQSAAPVAMSITPAAGSKVNPTTPIVVKATGGKITTVSVKNPSNGHTVAGALSADGTTWTSNVDLAFGATYDVDAVGANGDGKTAEQKSSVSTMKPAALAYANMVPAPASVTSIGVGQPLVFQFKNTVVNKKAVQDALTVTTTPSQPGAWYWVSGNEVHYRAQSYWQAGTTIKVSAKIYGLNFGGGQYGAEDRDVTYKVHDAWIAKANGATSHMAIYDNGHLVMNMPISMGKQATPTHDGPHVIQSKAQKVQMNSCTYGVCSGPKAYNETEYWAERIANSGEFVHENPDTVGAQGTSNVSHGCINLSETNAEWFFSHFNIGDVVEVTNSGGPPLSIDDRYGDWEVSWSKWQAGNA
jgi:lipoprotein-anchoring transpeptidase ErfK/SrfK